MIKKARLLDVSGAAGSWTEDGASHLLPASHAAHKLNKICKKKITALSVSDFLPAKHAAQKLTQMNEKITAINVSFLSLFDLKTGI
jgi:hypothetical protein